MADEYIPPEHGWTCFHCGDTFKTVGAARDHFGFDQSSDPACRIKAGAERGLVMALRKAEAAAEQAINALHDESGDIARAYAGYRSRQANAVRDAEELGYERGLADGMALQGTQP